MILPADLLNVDGTHIPRQSSQMLARACSLCHLVTVFRSAKTAKYNGETLNIDILLTFIVGAFQPKEFDGPEPESLHAAMVASSANHERPTQEVR
jgi:hypothetical protein